MLENVFSHIYDRMSTLCRTNKQCCKGSNKFSKFKNYRVDNKSTIV